MIRKNSRFRYFEKNLLKSYLKKNVQKDHFDLFQSNALNIPNKQAPGKKTIGNNQPLFVTKEIRKAIMTRLRLLSKVRKEKTEKNYTTYTKQRDFSVYFVRKILKNFFNNLNVKCITDNKTFWKIVKPYFSNKSTRNEKKL